MSLVSLSLNLAIFTNIRKITSHKYIWQENALHFWQRGQIEHLDVCKNFQMFFYKWLSEFLYIKKRKKERKLHAP